MKNSFSFSTVRLHLHLAVKLQGPKIVVDRNDVKKRHCCVMVISITSTKIIVVKISYVWTILGKKNCRHKYTLFIIIVMYHSTIVLFDFAN